MWRKLTGLIGAQSVEETPEKQFISGEEKERLSGITQPVRWSQVVDKPEAFLSLPHEHPQYAPVERSYSKTESDQRYYTRQQLDAKIPSIQPAPKQYVNGVLKANLTEAMATVYTNSSGVATVYLTVDGTPGGAAIFTKKPFITTTSENNVTGAHQVNNVEIKTVSADFKRVEFNVIRGRLVSLLGLTSTTEFAGAGVPVNVIAKGE